MSPLKYLRSEFPKLVWRAERAGFGWRYSANNGWEAWKVASLSPKYDGDDESYVVNLNVDKTATGEASEILPLSFFNL